MLALQEAETQCRSLLSLLYIHDHITCKVLLQLLDSISIGVDIHDVVGGLQQRSNLWIVFGIDLKDT
jgi:hypothetical protein